MIEYPHNKTHQKHNGKTVEQAFVVRPNSRKAAATEDQQYEQAV